MYITLLFIKHIFFPVCKTFLEFGMTHVTYHLLLPTNDNFLTFLSIFVTRKETCTDKIHYCFSHLFNWHWVFFTYRRQSNNNFLEEIISKILLSSPCIRQKDPLMLSYTSDGIHLVVYHQVFHRFYQALVLHTKECAMEYW